MKNVGSERDEVFTVNRRYKSYEDAASQLTDFLFSFVQNNRRFRITQRYEVENKSLHFDWGNLTQYYQQAYRLSMKR